MPQDHYHKMIELSAEARKAYEVMIANLETSSEEQEELEVETSEEPSGTEEPEYSMSSSLVFRNIFRAP